MLKVQSIEMSDVRGLTGLQLSTIHGIEVVGAGVFLTDGMDTIVFRVKFPKCEIERPLKVSVNYNEGIHFVKRNFPGLDYQVFDYRQKNDEL